MRAVRYTAYGELPELVTIAAPECPPDGAVIRVAATGVCRSDWHAWQGHDPVGLPHVPGHEFAGVVVEVGPDVREVHPRQRVTVPFVCGCGRCEFCRTGEAQVCPQQTQPGFTGPGSFADLVAVHAADLNVVPLPDSVDLVTAASLGCRFATAYRGLTTHGQVQPGQWVAVHGCGGVGLSAVMIASALGARVAAVDRSPAALALAAEVGAEVLVEASESDEPDAADASGRGSASGEDDAVVARIVEATGGGAAVSLDAVGSPATAVASVRCLRPRGRHVQLGLLLGEQATPPLPMDRVVARELSLHGSHGMPAAGYPGLLALVESGALRPDRLVGRVIGLEDAGAALAGMSRPAGAAGMTVVRVG